MSKNMNDYIVPRTIEELTAIADTLSENNTFIVSKKVARAIILQQLEANNNDTLNAAIVDAALDATVEMLKSSIVFRITDTQPINGPTGIVYFMDYTFEKAPKTMPADIPTSLQVYSSPIDIKTQQCGIIHEHDTPATYFTTSLVDNISDTYEELFIREIMKNIAVVYQPKLTSVQQWLINVNQQGAEIARNTRRGAGNVVILTHELLEFLYDQQPSTGLINDVGKSILHLFKTTGVRKSALAGTFNQYTILVSKHIGSEKYAAVVLYKGNTTTDSSAIFAPYVMIGVRPSTTDVITNQIQTTFNTRAGDFFTSKSPIYCRKVVFNS